MMNRATNGAGSAFGRYLASITERDIDLLLMEEFHISDEFVAWFCALLGFPDAQPVGAWHSVSDTDGETDLLLCITQNDIEIGVLIENKIDAQEQDLQAERYHLRGIKSRESGKFDDYITVVCAPQRYLDGLDANSPYVMRVSFESIAHWFSGQEVRRAAWRYQIISEAIERGRRGYRMQTNAVTTAFHMAYWEHLRRRHPHIQMARPSDRGAKSNWIIMKGIGFPKGVHLHHKIDQQVVELGFSGRTVSDILTVGPDLPEDVFPVQKGKTAALSLPVPRIEMQRGFKEQEDAVEAALKAVYVLIPIATLFEKQRP